MSGCEDNTAAEIQKAGTVDGVYSNKAAADQINKLTRALMLFHDRVGPVIAGDLFVKNYFVHALEVLTPQELDARIESQLVDDDKMVEQLMGILGLPRVSYRGDNTFLGQWGLHQTDELLEAYIRSQLQDVSGKEPSPAARAWLRETYGDFVRRRITDPELLRLIDFDEVPVTPGLGS